MLRSQFQFFPAVLLLLLAAVPATALTIDFEEFLHGEIVAQPTMAYPGFTLTVDNFIRGDFDVAVAFDTGVTGSLEPDLQYDPQTGWAAGNIRNTDLGNILIIQANDNCSDTVCAEPEDEGFRPLAGFLTFRLDVAATDFSFDLVDVDSITQEDGMITFYNLAEGEGPAGAIPVSSFRFDEFEGQNGVAYGDNSANHIDVEGTGTFNTLVIRFAGSGGVDNLEFTPIPEPTTAALVSLGLGGLAFSGRRRNRR